MNFSGRSVRLASRVIDIEDVFDVRMVCGNKCGTMFSKISVLMASFSVAASITKSVCPTLSKLFVGVIDARALDN